MSSPSPSGRSGKKKADLGPAVEFMRLIWALDHGLHVTSRKMFASMDLSGPERLVIRMVGAAPGILAGELAATLHRHPSSLTAVLERLERRELLARDPDPADRRRQRLTLTARGRKLDVPSPGTVEAAVTRVLARVSPAKVRAAREVLDLLSRELSS